MAAITSERKRLLALTGVALVTQVLLLLPLPPWLLVPIFLLWAGVIPGHLLAEVVGRDFGAPATRLEWMLYAVGAGYTLLLVITLLLNVVPLPVQAWHLHLAVDLVLLALVLAAWPIAGEDARPALPLAAWEPMLVALLGALVMGGALWTALAAGTWGVPAILDGSSLLSLIAPEANGFAARLPQIVAQAAAVGATFWLGRRLAAVAGLRSPVDGVVGTLAALGFFVGGVAWGYPTSQSNLALLLMALVLVRLWQARHSVRAGLALAALYLLTALLAWMVGPI